MMKTGSHYFAIALIAAGSLLGAAQPAFAQPPNSLRPVPAGSARNNFCSPSAKLIGEINAAYGTRFADPAGARCAASARALPSDRGARVAGKAPA